METHEVQDNMAFHKPAPHVTDEIVEVGWAIPLERIYQRIVEEVGDVPEPQVQEQMVEGFNVLPQQRVPERVDEKIVEAIQPELLERFQDSPCA